MHEIMQKLRIMVSRAKMCDERWILRKCAVNRKSCKIVWRGGDCAIAQWPHLNVAPVDCRYLSIVSSQREIIELYWSTCEIFLNYFLDLSSHGLM